MSNSCASAIIVCLPEAIVCELSFCCVLILSSASIKFIIPPVLDVGRVRAILHELQKEYQNRPLEGTTGQMVVVVSPKTEINPKTSDLHEVFVYVEPDEIIAIWLVVPYRTATEAEGLRVLITRGKWC